MRHHQSYTCFYIVYYYYLGILLLSNNKNKKFIYLIYCLKFAHQPININILKMYGAVSEKRRIEKDSSRNYTYTWWQDHFDIAI